jgi:hypothetical protein
MRKTSAPKNVIWSGAAAAAVVAAITLNVRAGSPALPGIAARGRTESQHVQSAVGRTATMPAEAVAMPFPAAGHVRRAIKNPFSAESALAPAMATQGSDLKKLFVGIATKETRHVYSPEEVSPKSLK